MAGSSTLEDPTCRVGYNGINIQSEVVKVHRALAGIAALRDVLGATFNVNQTYVRNGVTDQAIYKFQKDVMRLPANMCDATVDPGGPTWTRMKAAAGAGPAPAPAAPVAPPPSAKGQPRKLIAFVSARQVSSRYVKGFRIQPTEAQNGRFALPTYRMVLGYANERDEIVEVCKEYEVLRHGVSYDKEAFQRGAKFNEVFKVTTSTPIGITDLVYVPNFHPSKKHPEQRNPAWRFKSNHWYLIHMGPSYNGNWVGTDMDGSGLAAGLGCAMLCNYSASAFSADVREFSLGKAFRDSGDDACQTISDTAAFKINVQAAPTPMLLPYDDWSSIGGPRGLRNM